VSLEKVMARLLELIKDDPELREAIIDVFKANAEAERALADMRRRRYSS